VKTLGKSAGARCKHQRGVLLERGPGCAIYQQAGFPMECRLWSCKWLVEENLDLPRPDQGHYVVDIVPDYITATQYGKTTTVPVIQIWVSPQYPEAHREPRLRAWLEKMSQEGWCALVRHDQTSTMFLIPPLMSSTGAWEEKGAEMAPSGAHSAEDIASKLHNAGIMP
jgi:hypothetical protein